MLAIATLGAALLAAAPQSTDLLDAAFSEIERRLICEHYGAACRQPRPGGAEDDGEGKGKTKQDGKGKGKGGPPSGLPPGLARRDSLPPGLQKQLDEKGRLPPGLARRELPASLRERLPKRTPEVEIVVVDRDVLLIQAATGLVHDVIADIVRD
jgi:hypothetical protein